MCVRKRLMIKKHCTLLVKNITPDVEISPIPQYFSEFYEKYQDRLLYGTDIEFGREMYQITFRILEITDGHFYKINLFGYHWPLYGLNLKNKILKKIYYKNAQRFLQN